MSDETDMTLISCANFVRFLQRELGALPCLKETNLQILCRHEILLKILGILRITLYNNRNLLDLSFLTIIFVG
jgi:hypothetical protein